MPELRSPLGTAATRIVRPAASRVSPLLSTHAIGRPAARGGPRVLVYADSRATNVTGPLGKSVFGTYVSRLMRSYCVQPVVLPFSHTTLSGLRQLLAQPPRARTTRSSCTAGSSTSRHARSARSRGIAAAKSGEPGFRELFARHAAYHRAAVGPEYHGEPTTTLYSPEYLEDTLLPTLVSIPNLLWVTTNDFVPGWEGNYTSGSTGRHRCAHRRVREPDATGPSERRRSSHLAGG